MQVDWGPKYTHLLRTRAYLTSLPQGLASYPECRTKGSVWRNIAAGTDMPRLLEGVPPELGVLPDTGILGSAWFPAVQHFAAHLAMRDCLFASDDAIYQHFRILNRRLLSGPLYRVMFALVSPHLVSHASDRRFAALFQGVTLRSKQTGPNQEHVRLQYPEKLIPRLVARLYLTAFEAALVLAGAKGLTGKLTEYTDTESHYELSWHG
jgi:hypothetical protein